MKHMKSYAPYLFAAFVAILSLNAGCHEELKKTEEVNLGFDPANAKFQPDPLPKGVSPAAVTYRDANCYISGEFFCIVSIVDNKSYDWVRIWNRIQVLDSAGNVLTVNGDSSFILRAFADAVPPSGASAFFCNIPLKQISGVPDTCHFEGAGVLFQEPGPILVASESGGGVRIQRPDPKDPTKVQELAFNSQATIENPLPDTAEVFRLVYLVYGEIDRKLYFAQVIDPVASAGAMHQERTGPLIAGDKRRVFYPIVYEYLPQPLKDQRVGRADVQVYEVRKEK